jgi:hypothetical protein
MDQSGYEVGKTVTGTIKEINSDGKSFVIQEEKSGKLRFFTVTEKAYFRADKAVFDGKTKIGWSDLKVGQRVRVAYKEGWANEVKVLKAKS